MIASPKNLPEERVELDWQTGFLTLGLYAAAADFLYAAFGPRGHWPATFWFWP